MYSNVGVIAHQDFQKTKKKETRDGQKEAEQNGREKPKEPQSISTRFLNFIKRRITPIVDKYAPESGL
ncbi:UNVERIFIED_CONTAM: hypothetical protein PYX00_007358 [Menopon gallinae]|uniref:Uncharacterized protein n=1 Tax=Menopon gallinae TaxID=328185 RepID=A0AAW2HJI8_9NEOP